MRTLNCRCVKQYQSFAKLMSICTRFNIFRFNYWLRDPLKRTIDFQIEPSKRHH